MTSSDIFARSSKDICNLCLLDKEALNESIPLMPFDFAQEGVRQAHHERNQQLIVRPEFVEGLVQRFHNRLAQRLSFFR
jgi:hypothetical protein